MTKYIVLLSISIALLSSCRKDELVKEYTEQEAFVKHIHLPDSIRLGDKINFKAIAVITNGCGRISRYTLEETFDTAHLAVYTKYPVDANCAAIIFDDSTFVSFTSKRRGMYYFVFNSMNGVMKNDSIRIY